MTEKEAIELDYERQRQSMIDNGTYDRSRAFDNGLSHPDWSYVDPRNLINAYKWQEPKQRLAADYRLSTE